MINILLDDGESVFIQKTTNENEIIGINTLKQLEEASSYGLE